MAYRMLGSAMEAEDIVQEAYLRYRATPPELIRTLKSFLTTIVHHLCIDHLKSAQARRETYVGPWLPEPIITGDGASLLSPLRQIIDRESISMAFLVLLESLFVPALTMLATLAGVGMALVMAGAMATHLRRAEYPNIVGNLLWLGVALFVAYGTLVGLAV